MGKVTVRGKEFDLVAEDEALIQVLLELTKQIKRLADKRE